LSDPVSRDEVMRFVAQRLRVDVGRLSESTYFVSDLGLDSLRGLDLVCDIEERFGCEIPDKVARSLATIGDLIAFLARRV
jgi:acyl carrier protein